MCNWRFCLSVTQSTELVVLHKAAAASTAASSDDETDSFIHACQMSCLLAQWSYFLIFSLRVRLCCCCCCCCYWNSICSILCQSWLNGGTCLVHVALLCSLVWSSRGAHGQWLYQIYLLLSSFQWRHKSPRSLRPSLQVMFCHPLFCLLWVSKWKVWNVVQMWAEALWWLLLKSSKFSRRPCIWDPIE